MSNLRRLVYILKAQLGSNLHKTLSESSFQHDLGPNKHGRVTYIQVNVYIGNTLSWLIGG